VVRRTIESMNKMSTGPIMKRARVDTALDDINIDLHVGHIVSRILMTKEETARVIGRKGENINRVRNTTGAQIKACHVEDDNSVCIIYGEPNRVADAFEQMITKIARMNDNSVRLNFLVDSNNAGRVLGHGGTVINGIRIEACADRLGFEKHPTMIGGMNVRILMMEGSFSACGRVHVLYHRLFDYGIFLSTNVDYHGHNGHNGHRIQHEHEHGSHPPPPPPKSSTENNNNQSRSFHSEHGLTIASQESNILSPPPNLLVPQIISSDVLLERGVPASSVTQLNEMNTYLRANFGVEILFSKV
jgi:predicted RNA-binding protein YlqC (UPF0109 family)